MLAKLLALLAQSKGGVLAAVVLAGATTATVAVTSPDVQNTFGQLVSTTKDSDTGDCDHGQPAVVAQRNAADKLLRAAYQTRHEALNDLRHQYNGDPAAEKALRSYDDQLRDTLNVALNKVAALTLGRDGQVRGTASASAKPSASAQPSASETAKPSCSPKPSASASAKPSASATPSGSASPEVQGRVAVAERTTLDADLQKIVDDAIAAMDKTVKDATAALASLPTPDHGRPSGAGKPSGSPKH